MVDFSFFTPKSNAPQNPYQGLGLLGEQDKSRAMSMGLLQLGAALSEAGAPSYTPNGSGFSRGAANAAKAYQGALDSSVNRNYKAQQFKRQQEKYDREIKRRQKWTDLLEPISAEYEGGPTIDNVPMIGKQTSKLQQAYPSISPQELEFLKLSDYDKGMSYLMGKNKEQVIAPGATVYRNGKAVFTAPSKPTKQSDFDMLMERAGIKKGSPQYIKMATDWAKRKGMSPTTNINMKTESKKLEEIAIKNEKFRSVWASNATNAQSTLKITDAYRSLNDESKNNPQVTSLPGWGFDFVKTLANAFGVDSSTLNNRTLIDQKGTEFILDLYNKMGGARGITDTELKTFQRLYAESDNNPKAREDLLDWIEEKAITTIETYKDFSTEAGKQEANQYWRADEYLANKTSTGVNDRRTNFETRKKTKAQKRAEKKKAEEAGLSPLLNKIKSMGKAELSKLDITVMTPAELEASRLRFEQLKKMGGF